MRPTKPPWFQRRWVVAILRLVLLTLFILEMAALWVVDALLVLPLMAATSWCLWRLRLRRRSVDSVPLPVNLASTGLERAADGFADFPSRSEPAPRPPTSARASPPLAPAEADVIASGSRPLLRDAAEIPGATARAAPPRRATPTAPVAVPPPAVGPDHFRRHAGIPGFLYAAKNSEHLPGLFKVGYTTLSPAQRLAELNREHLSLEAPGGYGLVASEVTVDTFNSEQLLFDMLSVRRLSPGREFFWATADELVMLLRRAAALAAQGNWQVPANSLSATADARWNLEDSCNPTPLALSPGQHGWLAVLRNPVYRMDLYRIIGGATDPLVRCRQLNDRISGCTAGVGYWHVVHQVAAAQPQLAFEVLKREISGHSLASGTNCYVAPLGRLVTAIQDVVQRIDMAGPGPGPKRSVDRARATGSHGQAANPPAQPAARPHSEIPGVRGPDDVFTVAVMPAYVPREMRPWTIKCSGCQVNLALRAQIGAIGTVQCPRVQHEGALPAGGSGL